MKLIDLAKTFCYVYLHYVNVIASYPSTYFSTNFIHAIPNIWLTYLCIFVCLNFEPNFERTYAMCIKV